MFKPDIKSRIASSIQGAVERAVKDIACNIGDYIDINDYIDDDDIGTIVSETIEDAIMDL